MFTILGKAGTWYRVEFEGPTPIRGFFPINRVVAGVLHRNDSIQCAVVTSPDIQDRLNLRSSVSETSASLGRYFVGTQVEVLESNVTNASSRDQMWHKVRVSGKTGFMKAIFLQDVPHGDPSTW